MPTRRKVELPTMRDIYEADYKLRFIRLPEVLCELDEGTRRVLQERPLYLHKSNHTLKPLQHMLVSWLAKHTTLLHLKRLCRRLADCSDSEWDIERLRLIHNGFDLYPYSLDCI